MVCTDQNLVGTERVKGGSRAQLPDAVNLFDSEYDL